MTIAGRAFQLRNTDVAHALSDVEPEPITSHYVVIGARRFPPKQAISVATGLDRADFTTHHARRALMRLGFRAGRRQLGAPAAATSAGPHDAHRLPDRLRPLAGRWVAIKDDDVLHEAATPHRLIAWLAEHGQKADSVFRVPEDERAATGLAPL